MNRVLCQLPDNRPRGREKRPVAPRQRAQFELTTTQLGKRLLTVLNSLGFQGFSAARPAVNLILGR